MQLGQVLHRSFRSLSENCYSRPATLDQQSDAATLATLILRGQTPAGPDAQALRSGWDRLTRLNSTSSSIWQTFAIYSTHPRTPTSDTSTLEEFGWYGQRRMAQSVVENRDSAFKAAHDVSKLTVAVSEPVHGCVRSRRAQ